MRSNQGQFGLAIGLILIGAIILLGRLGLRVDGVLSYIIPIVLIALGYFGIRQGRALIGWIVLAIGVFILLGKLTSLITFLIPVALIAFGIWMLVGRRGSF